MLTDVTWKPFVVDPKREKRNPIVVKLHNTLHHQTLDFIDRFYERAIESAISDDDRLTWTKAGALFGHQSKLAKHDVDRLWERVISTVGDGKECLMAVGALLRIKIAERPEDWYVVKQDTGEFDPFTGKPVYVSEYWIRTT